MTIKKQNFKKIIKNILPVAAVLAAILTCLICALAASPNNNASRVDASNSSAQPGAFLELNYQNFTVLADTENDWYTSARPTQKGLYQIAAEYIDGEGVSFRYNKNNRTPDPMIYLPVYAIILGEEIGTLPIEDLSLGFFFRMDVELVEDHQLLVLQVVERPLLGLAIGRLIGAERRVAGLGKLYPHAAHGL